MQNSAVCKDMCAIYVSSRVSEDPVLHRWLQFQRNTNLKYTPTTLTKEEILVNHRSVLRSFGISTKDEELDLPSLYWIPKSHKCPFKQRYIAGSAKCSTKPLSKLLTIGGQNRDSELLYISYSRVVWIRCGYWRTLKIC
jgi:hypothetical protein